MFELYQVGPFGTQGEGLGDTQQAGSTKKQAPHQSYKQITDLHFMSSPIFWDPKMSVAMNPMGQQHDYMDQGQVTNDQVSWLRPVLKKQGVDVEDKKNGVDYDPNFNFGEKDIPYVNKTGMLVIFIHVYGGK